MDPKVRERKHLHEDPVGPAEGTPDAACSP